jgi:23S rRNA pseudouridine1911/1915/1917 synthase
VPPGPADPSARKLSRSGGDTPRSTKLIQHGGSVDREALLRAIQTQPPAGAAPAEADDDAGAAPLASLEADVDRQGAGAVDDDAPNRVVFVLQRDLQKRLDKYLADRIPFMSRTQLQRLIDEGGVTVNGRRPKGSTKLRSGDRVEVFVPPPPPTEVVPEDIPIEVLFEDRHLVVLNKRPDIIVHPARSHNKGTLINALAYHFQHRSATGGGLSKVGEDFARPGVVHRLDRHTSGLIVFAKDDEAHWKLAQQFEQRRVDKRYLAITHGVVEPDVDVIDEPLGPHPSREKGLREKYVVRRDHLGKPSVTIRRTRAVFRPKGPEVDSSPASPHRGYSLVELELKTGRTHQIRVHLSHQLYPIVGDDLYGGRAVGLEELGLSGEGGAIVARQALHAAVLGFRHPITGEPMRFTAPWPADMGRLLAELVRATGVSGPSTPPGATVDLSTLWPGGAASGVGRFDG